MTHIVAKAGCIVAVALAAAASLSSHARAQDKWPNQPIRFVVAFAPGGITDIIARLIGERLSDKLGQPVVIDNKGGAGGAIAAKIVSAAKPDGYTFLVTTTAVTIGAASSPSLVDPRTQLSPVAMVASAPALLAMKGPTDIKNLGALAREHSEITYSSAGVGTVEHLTAAYVLGGLPGVKATHVPYRSGGEAVNAVIGGHVTLASLPLGTARPFLQDKQLQALGVASHARLAALPDVPTFGESGLPKVENGSWVSIFGPPGLLDAIAQQLNADVNQILGRAEFLDRLTSLGFDARASSQKQFVEEVRTEVDRWGVILKETGITLN